MRIIIILGASGLIGRQFIEFLSAKKNDPQYLIYALDINLTPLTEDPNRLSSNLRIIEADTVYNDYISLLNLNPGDEITFINLVAKDYPVTKNGIIGNNCSPFSLSTHEFCDSINITCASTYNLLHLIDKYCLCSSHVVLVGSIYSHMLPIPSLYSDNDSIYKPIAYSSGKYGQIPLLKQAARYLAIHGGRCNCLSFGGIEAGQSGFFMSSYSKIAPQKQLVPISDVLKMLFWVTFDSPLSLNGSDIVVDGGFSC